MSIISRHGLRLLLSLALGTSLISCVEEPGVSEEHKKPSFKHELALDQACSECHEQDKPDPIEDHPHGGGKECSECHVAKDDHSGWLPRIPFSHSPKPKSCLDCHVQDRPDLETHPKTGDCVACHNYPSFKG